MSTYTKTSSVIIKNLYPFIEKCMDKYSSKFKDAMAIFINKNSEQMYDVAPYDIIYHTRDDINNLFNALHITEQDVITIMEDCYFWKIPYNPPAAKEPYVLVCMMAIRYFLLHARRKDAEITAIYLAFSGKIYASLYGGVVFPKAPPSKYHTVMDFVVNNMLNDKFDLHVYGNMFSAIRQLCITWMNTYGNELCKNPDDDDIGGYIQQLRDREKSFLMNIAKLYYQAYENRNYLNYETDNLSDSSEFRITDNDSLRATRYTENTVNYLVNNAISLQFCNKCKDENIKPTEIKDIMESIIGDQGNLNDIYRVVNIMICDYMSHYPGGRIGSVQFMAHCIKNKPNTKDKYIIEYKQIILTWLDENSPNYRRRKSRKATASSYYKAIVMYLTLAIMSVSK